MRKRYILLTLILLLSINISAQSSFKKSAEIDSPQLLQEGSAKTWCPVCGMNLNMFYKTNHALKLEDGDYHQYCSIRCLAVDLKKHPDQLHTAKVIDVHSEHFIDAADASYVIGSKAPGTMTKVSKLAFKSKRKARAFSKKMRGKEILGFDEALALSRKQMKADNAMLMKKKQTVVFPKGKALFNKLFTNIDDIPSFSKIGELKVYLKTQEKSKSLDERKLQMLALYILNTQTQKQNVASSLQKAIEVSKDEKCPVCGMFVYKYPRWAATLAVDNSKGQKTLYFDGVKDLMKFYFEPQKWGKYEGVSINNVLVTDYYTQVGIDGKHAVYVIGSDILGPMGHELIPFESIENAKVFLDDHSGTKILKFNEIKPELLVQLDK